MKTLSRIGLTVLVTLYAFDARASYKEDYLEGLEALERNNWSEAARLLARAAADQPKSQAKMRLYGMRFQTYLPHFYLGKAQFELGDCNAARGSFASAMSNDVIKKMDELRDLERLDAECESRVARTAEAQRDAETQRALQVADQVKRAENLLQRAEAQLTKATSVRDESVWTTQWQPNGEYTQSANALQQQVSALRGDVAQAREALDVERLAGMERAFATLENEANAFDETVSRSLRLLRQEQRERESTRIAQRDQAARDSAAQAAAAKAAANEAITAKVEKATAVVAGWPNGMSAATSRARLQALVTQAYGAGDATLSELTALDRNLATTIRSAEQEIAAWQKEIASRPPEALVIATNEYFQGNYERSLQLIEAFDPASETARFYRSLFAAAARFQLGTLGGGENRDALYAQAQTDVAAARQIVGRLELDERIFSPKFIAFARSVN